MPLSYSLLLPPLRQRVQLPWFWPAPPADGQAIGNQPLLFPYAFRPGGFWQPQKFWLQPTPADVALPNAPTLTAYVFRKGGFWPPQQRWGIQPPAEVALPNAPLWRQYAFRRGGLWQFFRSLIGVAANPPIFTPYIPPPIGSPTGEVSGSSKYNPMGSPGGAISGTTLPAPIGNPTQN